MKRKLNIRELLLVINDRINAEPVDWMDIDALRAAGHAETADKLDNQWELLIQASNALFAAVECVDSYLATVKKDGISVATFDAKSLRGASEMKKKFQIEDWAGNVKFNGKLFASFDDADEFLCEHLNLETSDDYEREIERGEFYISEVSK